LTANLQLQLRCNPLSIEHGLVPAELDRAPPHRASRRRLFRPRAERAARPLTSSVATTPFELGIAAALALAIARPRRHRRLVKDDGFAETRTPSLDERSSFQTLPVDFCNQNSPRAQPLDRPTPDPLLSTRLAQLALDRRG
jgi:hypothetical protein